MRIYFRYLFLRVLVPFSITLFACAIIWTMVDLYGNIDDFLTHKVGFGKIIFFYSLQIPNMLVQVLPAAILFSTLWTLLSLNRRSEFVAFQAGGMAPMRLFSPFLLFTAIWVLILGFDLNWPAAKAQVTRDRVLLQVKGHDAKKDNFTNLVYVDTVNHRAWMFNKLDVGQNTGEGVDLKLRNPDGRTRVEYFARKATWNGDFWQLSGVKEFLGPDGPNQTEKVYEVMALPDITTPPQQLSIVVSQPEQLTVAQLTQYIKTSTTTPLNLAKYRTEWWYRVLHPLSLIVLVLFALLQGSNAHRGGAVVGVVWAIAVLFFYLLIMNIFLAAGRYNRIPPFLAVFAAQFIFGLVAIHLMAVKYGWWWQLQEYWKQWQQQRAAARFVR